MPFDTTQNSYLALRKVMAERTRQVVVFCGAGLSRPAKMPTWSELRAGLLKSARKEVEYRTENLRRDQALLDVAEREGDYWRAFAHIKEVLGDTTYTAEIRREFEHADRTIPPEEYCDLWRMPIAGFVTLNLDGLVKRATSCFQICGRMKMSSKLSSWISICHGIVTQLDTRYLWHTL
ncbi:MAG: hypothetical protein KIT44_02985 [Opitutaceae bacterium]|nr:hypothetical protein [Opitutaceae bacterium]